MRVGADLVRLDRIERALARYGDRFLARLLTETEREAGSPARLPPPRRVERVGGRFAAKEAVLKLLGTGWGGGLGWWDVEVLDARDEPRGGAPRVRLSPRARARARRLGVRGLSLSITHEKDLAMAVAVASGRPA